MEEFNPIEKLPELAELLREYNPIISRKSDKGYDGPDEASFCITVPGPGANEGLMIEGSSSGEFILCYSYYHSHYSANEYEYSCMCEQIFDLLNSKCGCAAIFCANGDKCVGSKIIKKDEASLPLEEIFHFVLKYNKLADELCTNGIEARFVFWDSSLNKTEKLKIERLI